MAPSLLQQRLRRDRIGLFGLALVVLVIAAAVLAPGLAPSDPLRGDLRHAVVFVVIGVVGWAGISRLVRIQVLVLKRAEFVVAARGVGALERRVLPRHLRPVFGRKSSARPPSVSPARSGRRPRLHDVR